MSGTLPFRICRHLRLLLACPPMYTPPLGRCQTSEYDEFFYNLRPGTLDYFAQNGDVIRFDRPFNFLSSYSPFRPHLDLRAPWLGRLELRERKIVKHFRQYEDLVYRLEKIEDLNANSLAFTRDEVGLLWRIDSSNGLALAFENDARGHRTCVALIGIGGARVELARYAYDARGRMTAAECAFGMSVRYHWHRERDLLLCRHDTTRRSETHFAYDDAGRILHTRTNGIWNDDRFRYDHDARETTYLPSGEERLARRSCYDENDNVTRETDALGHALQRVFDAAGFETAITDANGSTTVKTYDIRGNIGRHVDAEGRATTYAWGPHGTLDMVIDGAGKIRRWEHDERGNTLAETCAEGHTTRFLRDARGRLIRTILPDGAEESRGYDAHGRLTSIIDARGGVTRFAHDAFGRVIETTDAFGGVTRYEHAAGAGGFATPTAIIRPDGVRVARTFTEGGTLASVTDGEGRAWRYAYGAFDVLLSIEDPGGGKLTFAHDGEGRVVAFTNQTGVTYHLIRDAAGRVIAEQDFEGRRTDYTRDPCGRLTEMRKPDGVRLVYGYDKTDKLTSIRSYAADASAADPPLDETHYWYDRRGLLVRASNQAALVELVRDGNGGITRETVNGRTIDSKLDACGNRIERRIGAGEPGERLVAIARVPLGMVAAIAIDDHAPLVFTRDALGRETRRASTKGFRLDQSFDAVGQLVSQSAGHGVSSLSGLAAPNAPPTRGTGAQRRYAWDKANAPLGIDDLIWGEARYDYDANGQVAKVAYGDGSTEKFDYDAAKNVVGIALQGPRLGGDFGRLLSWRSTPGGVVQLARGPNGEAIALTHDVCGRVVTRRVERKGFRPRIWHYSWDAHDRLVRCENPEGETWFYRYDPFGRRLTKVRKLAAAELAWTAQKHAALVPEDAREATKIWTWPTPPNGASADDTRAPIVGTHFLWDADDVAEEAPLRLDGSIDWMDAVRWHYEPETFRPLAKQEPDNTLLPIVNDHLGTPHEMFDEGGGLTWTAKFGAWGDVKRSRRTAAQLGHGGGAIFPRDATVPAGDLAEDGDTARDCPFRFPGQYADQETSLYYNRHRYYDPLAAQYTSPDPIKLDGGLRAHGYVTCPTRYIDPLGLNTSALARDAQASGYGGVDNWQNTTLNQGDIVYQGVGGPRTNYYMPPSIWPKPTIAERLFGSRCK